MHRWHLTLRQLEDAFSKAFLNVRFILNLKIWLQLNTQLFRSSFNLCMHFVGVGCESSEVEKDETQQNEQALVQEILYA